MFGLKNWQPFIDTDGRPSGFQSCVRKLLRTNRTPTLPALEWILLTAGREHGKCRMAHFTFRPSGRLRALCSMRRSAADVGMRKFYSFEIRKLHRQEIRLWKNLRLKQSLGRASHWKALRNMIHTTAGQAYASEPPLDEFADALATIFSGNQFFPDRPAALTETNWTLAWWIEERVRPFEGQQSLWRKWVGSRTSSTRSRRIFGGIASIIQ